MSIQPYQIGDLQAWDEELELADFQLANSPADSHISSSLMQDA